LASKVDEADTEAIEGRGSTAISYAWFVWRKAASGSSRVLWIPAGCRLELARLDDVARFAAWSLAPADAPLLDRVST
jgi:hypothetical protein